VHSAIGHTIGLSKGKGAAIYVVGLGHV